MVRDCSNFDKSASHIEPRTPQLAMFRKVPTMDLLPRRRKFLVASSAAGATHLHLQGVGVGRLPLRNLLEHHATIAQPLELIGLVNLGEQVRLVIFCVDLPQLADAVSSHRSDRVLPCIDVAYFATFNRTVCIGHSCCVVDAMQCTPALGN